MKIGLSIFQIILSLVLCILIFLQSNDDDSRSNIMSSTTFQKRGWERIIFFITLFVLVLFLISSIIQTII